jgi:signal transduction histidine kinase
MPRIFFLPFTKIGISFIASLILGVIVVFIESSIDNVLQKKEIHQEFHAQIKRTIEAYKATHQGAGPQEVAQFIARYVEQVLPEQVIAAPPISDNPEEIDDEPIWSMEQGTGKLQLFLNPKYVGMEATGADVREITDGVLASLLIFFAFLVYVTKSEQSKLERRLHDEERHRLTTALHEQEAYALLGRMTAMLSHELRTPVATISNLVQSLPKRIGDGRFAERFIQLSQQELERMQRLIDNLLIYGKDLKIDNSTWIDLKRLIHESSQRHALSATIDDIQCYGDKFYLDILFTNLLRNSAEAGASEVRISLSKSAVNDRAMIDYQDNGKGFVPDLDLKPLLSPFVTTRSKGAGLGLYLSDKIVRAHGGELEPYRIDHGAGFRIWLPADTLKSTP